MRRGILLVLALLGASFAVPASAAPSRWVTYEVVRVRDAATTSIVWVDRPQGSAASAVLAAAVSPLRGGGYRYDGALYSYGGGSGSIGTSVALDGGRRFLVGGTRGRFQVRPEEEGWSVREVANAYREAAGDTRAAGLPVDQTGEASAPAGRYGAVAYASMPCGVGTGSMTLTTDVGESWSSECDPMFGLGAAFGHTRAGRSWRVHGEFTGVAGEGQYRLSVLDLPRPPR